MSDLDGKGVIHRVIGGQHCLVPADIAADDWLQGVPVDREIVVTARRPRHPEHHRLVFAALSTICANRDDYADVDALLDSLKIAMGFVRKVRRFDGRVDEIPNSISFDAMGEDQFKRWVDRADYCLSMGIGISLKAVMGEIAGRKR